MTDADTIAIFVNLYQSLEVAQKVPFADVPDYDPSMGDLGSTIGPVGITLKGRDRRLSGFARLRLCGHGNRQDRHGYRDALCLIGRVAVDVRNL